MGFSRQWKELAGPIILFAALFAPGYLFQSAEGAAISLSSATALFQHLVLGLPQAALLLYFILTRTKVDRRDAGIVRLRGKDLPKIAIVLIGLGILSALTALAGSVFSNTGFMDRVSIPRDSVGIVLLVFVCITTGYREELYFRSYFLSHFHSYDTKTVVAASTLLFSIGHLYQGITGFVGTALTGLFLSIMFLRYKNIHIIAIGHGLYNLAAILLTQIGRTS